MHNLPIVIFPAEHSHGLHAEELLASTTDAVRRLRQSVSQVIVGQEQVLDLMLIALFSRGHALLVGVPGLAKTLLVSTLAQSLNLSFSRIQFTPDLLPADITGTDVLQEQIQPGGGAVRTVRFLPGPVFANLVLADEINRTPPKTQAALLQAMQERCVTVGTNTHPLGDPFHVFATRNPIEQEGTYPLPEAQLDRFLLEIHVDYPSEIQERLIATRTTQAHVPAVQSVLDIQQISVITQVVPRIAITDDAVRWAVAISRATRPGGPHCPQIVNNYVRFGAGPRASQALVLCAKARAAIDGRPAAQREDVDCLLCAALRHRLVLNYRAEADGVTVLDVIEALKKIVL